MKALLLFLLAVLMTACPAESLPPRLVEANHLFATGQGLEALRIYRALVQEATAADSLSPASRECFAGALAGQIRAALRFGDRTLADSSIDLATRTFPEDARLLILAGCCAEKRGALDRATQLWKEATRIAPSSLEARFRLAEAERVLDATAGLAAPYQWFVDEYNRRKKVSPEDLEWIGRACVRLEKYEEDGAQKAYQEALDASPALEPLLVAKADLWLDRYDETSALKFYGEALQVNPQSIEALLGIAQANRERGDFSGCKRALQKILELNPSEPLALALSADLSFYDQLNEEGQSFLERGYASNPHHLTLLAVEATYAIRRKRWDDLEKVSLKASSFYGNPSEFHFQLAECLERNYLFREADHHHALCLASDPGNKRAVAARAMLAARITAASAELALEGMKSAFQSDRFHLRLFNMRNLFTSREKFERLESPHFILRIAPEAGEVYGQLALDSLEETYSDLSAKYHHEHPGKTLVEVYEDPDDFSIRIAGLPGTGLAGVCFGDIVILMAPRRSRMAAINWGNNLRHELAHTFSLALTESRIPRWYTEGLSVLEEWDPGTSADPLLTQAYRQGSLVGVQALDLNFHRPDNVGVVGQVYAQSGEVVRFLTGKFGFEIHQQLLERFRTGQTTTEVVPAVTGLSLDEINAAVKDLVRKRIDLGPPLSPLAMTAVPDPADIEAASSEQGRLLKEIEGLAGRDQWEEALGKINGWLEHHPASRSLLEARATAAFRAGQKREARKTAEALLTSGTPSYAAEFVLGMLDRDNKKWDRSIAHFLAAQKLRPRFVGPGSPIREVEEIERKRQNALGLAEALRMRLTVQPTDGKSFLELAKLGLDLNKPEWVREGIRQAAFTEPFSPETQLAWARHLLAEGKPHEALVRFRVAARLDEQSGRAQLGIAQALMAASSPEGALHAAEKALELDPTLEEAKTLLGSFANP
jgi:tetratricopeptide (TPR) repeat protein